MLLTFTDRVALDPEGHVKTTKPPKGEVNCKVEVDNFF